MQLLIIVAALCVATFALPSGQMFNDELNAHWEAFKTHHAKSYEGSEEFIRRAIWEQNVKHIQNHNLEADRGLHGHRLGMNKYGDLTDEEYAKYLTGFRPNNKTRSAPVFLPPENVELPKEVDWREKGYVTDVKDQGACGSCWTFSATGSLEGQHFKKTGKLVSLSEQNIVDCATKLGGHGCHGGTMDIAFKYIAENDGVDTEISYPYTAKDGTCHYIPADMGADDGGSIDIEHGSEEALKTAVATVGPISVAIDASAKDFRFYKDGVYTSTLCSSERLDHGVLAVGYGKLDGELYWLVKNSWGTSWGKDGYIMMRRNHHNMCGIATMASYPKDVK